MHGVFVILTRHFKRFFEEIPLVFNWMITFGFINVTWVLFRAESIEQAFEILHKIMLLDFGTINENINKCFQLRELQFLFRATNIEELCPNFLLLMFFIISIIVTIGGRSAFEKMNTFKPSFKNLLMTIILMIWCICSLCGMSTFLYFNF